MSENEEVQTVRNHLNQGKMRHKVRVPIERLALVVVQKLEIAEQMDNEEQNHKQTRQTHGQFATNGRSKVSR